MQTLIVTIGNSIFAVPADVVVETLEVRPADIKGIHNRQVLVLRKDVIPFLALSDLLNISRREEQNEMIAIIVYAGDKTIALGVDEVLDQMENIVKPFDVIAQQFKGFSGGTILGDGRVALLLDIADLMKDEGGGLIEN